MPHCDRFSFMLIVACFASNLQAQTPTQDERVKRLEKRLEELEKEVAELLNVSLSWLQKGRVYGQGPDYIKLKSPKGAIRYRISDIEQFVEQSQRAPGSK